MHREYAPNPIIIDRAVEIWKEMLTDPKYDNIGTSQKKTFQDTMSSALAGMLPKNNAPEVLEKFGEELKKIISEPFTTTSGHDGKPYTRMVTYLNVDYHPDEALRTAAERAGLKMQFPWKTSMWIGENNLYVSYGYAAPCVYHYPLKNNQWLVTTLNGEDISKIITLVEQGIITGELLAA